MEHNFKYFLDFKIIKLNSKGCAFVTYFKKQSAINAIKSMNHSETMEV